MPKLDHMAEEGVLLAWHKREGDAIKKGDILFEFESEKATEEVIAEESGVLLKIVAGEGETVPVSAPVAVIGEEGEEVPANLAALASAGNTDVKAGAGTTAGKAAGGGEYTERRGFQRRYLNDHKRRTPWRVPQHSYDQPATERGPRHLQHKRRTRGGGWQHRDTETDVPQPDL